MKPSFDQFWAGQISAFKGAIKIAESLQQEQPDIIEHICLSAGISAPFMDGNQWSILKGDNIQVGVVGFGDTKEDALINFIKDIPIQQEQPPTEREIAEAHRYAEIIRERDKARIQQEQPEVDLEEAARHVYESWMGGTMDDVRRDMAELGKVLNARKEE